MVFEYELPDVGEGLAEAEIVEWLVEPGDAVTEDEVLAQAETDKAVVDVPSPVDGTIAEILVGAGEMAAVGEVIVTIEVEGEVDEDAVEAEPERADEAGGGAAGEAATPEPGEAGGDGTEAAAGGTGRTFAAPSARRLARERGVDLGAVEGSGPGGRVTEADVRAHAEGGGAESVEAAATDEQPGDGEAVTSAVERAATSTDDEPAASAGESSTATAAGAADRDRTLAVPATRRVADEAGVDIDAVPAVEERDGEAFVTADAVREYADAQQAAQAADARGVAAGPGERPEEREPYRGIRRTIGEAMERSKYTAPHVTHHDEVDVTRLVEVRERLDDEAEARGSKLTYVPFVMKAVVAALKEHPVLNSQLDEEAEEVVYKRYYNIGVATATDAGLMVPVVEDVDHKGLLELGEEMRELVAKARDRSIAREEMQGGTFSITNFGAIGGEYATPIINYPETAILGLGAIKDRPRVHDGEVVPRKVLTLSLSIDHRVIDGAEAAAFTNQVKAYLEEPELLLLE